MIKAPPVDVAVLFFMVVMLNEELTSPLPPPPPPQAVKKAKQTSFMNLVFISHQLTIALSVEVVVGAPMNKRVLPELTTAI